MIPKLRGINIVKTIGNGAGSVVFEAVSEETGERLAVKSVTPKIVEEIQRQGGTGQEEEAHQIVRQYLRQIRNEWRMGRRLTSHGAVHPGIPRMHRLYVERSLLGLTRGLHLVMDLAPGESLRKGRTHTIDELIGIYRQAAEIVRFIHLHGVIHADLKPQHLMVDEAGRVVVLDLGLACRRGGHTRKMAGSPDYMAPEQVAGWGVDERTDVFGLGATMFWALAGRTIRSGVVGGSAMGTMQLNKNSYHRSIREFNRDVPPVLEDIVMRSCAWSQDARPSVHEVITGLQRLS